MYSPTRKLNDFKSRFSYYSGPVNFGGVIHHDDRNVDRPIESKIRNLQG